MADQDVIDPTGLATLLDSIGGDEAFLDELIEAYFEDAPNLLAEMRQSLSSGEAGAFRRAAHSLKSNSANFGAIRLSKMCGELEDLARPGGLEGAEIRLAQVEAEYERVKSALQVLRSSG